MSDLQVLGLDRLLRRLKGIRSGVQGPIWTQAMQAGLDVEVAEIRGRAPRDTGALQESIEGLVTVRGDQANGILRAGVEYGIYVEFPTRPHFVPAGHIGGWAQRHGFGATGLKVSGKAQPFFRRNERETFRQAAERVRDTVAGKMAEFLRDLI